MATVGGMASTNAHGMRAVKYGPTSAWVLGLEVVLPDGTLIETGSVGSRAKQSSAGLELTKLFVGAEGTLGVITRLRLKLMPIPPARAIVLALFDVLENAGRAVQAVFGAGISPSAIEILDERCIQAVNLYRPALGLPRRRGAAAVRGGRQPAGRALRRRAGGRGRPAPGAGGRVVGRAGANRGAVGGALGRGRGGRRCCGRARTAPTAARTSACRWRASPRRCGRSRTSAPGTASRSPPTATSAAAACTPAT